MDADGGASKYSGNKAGAKYGTGYCDSQCPRDLKFINGEVSLEFARPCAIPPWEVTMSIQSSDMNHLSTGQH